MRRSGLTKTAMSERARRILSLVPEKNANSDTSDGASSGDEAGMIGSAESSPAPSINSSLERLNLLQISDDQIGTHVDDIYVDTTDVPLTPILTQVFPNPSESNYDALPSISSLPSLLSNQPIASTPVRTPLTRAQKMKRKSPEAQNRRKIFSLPKTSISTQG
ncbi:uncharacterized protein LOC131854216 [Achroia grisella]|uniref:uncharacterized protein LOC131854216 n=1 Tax=Achroia grisella TaxID=688607 RepID=UPI0027D33931|nr:uncharacterized protein LOC131854216 [Achroia grisella]